MPTPAKLLQPSRSSSFKNLQTYEYLGASLTALPLQMQLFFSKLGEALIVADLNVLAI
jgi:hypothetical protein